MIDPAEGEFIGNIQGISHMTSQIKSVVSPEHLEAVTKDLRRVLKER